LTTFNAIADFVSHQQQTVFVDDVDCLSVVAHLSQLIFHPSSTAADCSADLSLSSAPILCFALLIIYSNLLWSSFLPLLPQHFSPFSVPSFVSSLA